MIIHLILFLITVYSFLLAVLYFFQEKFLFYPGTTPFKNCPEMKKRSAVAVRSGNLRYYLKQNSSPDNWIIIFHGNAGNACERTYFLDFFEAFSSNIVVLEYPGFGNDVNSPGEFLILNQALELVSHIKEQNHDSLPVYLMGESLGTGVATWVATQIDISGLILISSYTSIASVAQYHYPWAPAKYLLKHKFRAEAWAGKADAPVIQFHGTKDEIIPIEFARQQHINFNHEKKFVEIPGCGHNDILDAGKNQIQNEIYNFISKTSL